VRELLLGLVGGLIVIVTAWFSRSSVSRDASHSERAIDKATTSHEKEVEVVEEILEGGSPETDLADLINEKLND
tara:strand:+ start:996 stop:1217 length:222 start_codon:yes stop_codon:yes gene_type:complete